MKLKMLFLSISFFKSWIRNRRTNMYTPHFQNPRRKLWLINSILISHTISCTTHFSLASLPCITLKQVSIINDLLFAQEMCSLLSRDLRDLSCDSRDLSLYPQNLGHDPEPWPMRLKSPTTRLEYDPRDFNCDPWKLSRNPQHLSHDLWDLSRDPREFNCDPWDLNCDPWDLSHDPQHLSRDPQDLNCDPWDLSRDPWVVTHNTWVDAHATWVATHNTWVATYETWAMTHITWDTIQSSEPQPMRLKLWLTSLELWLKRF